MGIGDWGLDCDSGFEDIDIVKRAWMESDLKELRLRDGWGWMGMGERNCQFLTMGSIDGVLADQDSRARNDPLFRAGTTLRFSYRSIFRVRQRLIFLLHHRIIFLLQRIRYPPPS